MKFTILPIATAALLTSSCTANTIEDDVLTIIRNNLHTLIATKMDYNFLLHPGHGGEEGHEHGNIAHDHGDYSHSHEHGDTAHDHGTSNGDVSPECESEIEALGENKDLLAAGNTLGESCPISVEGTTVKQDFGSCDAGPVQLACTSAGGKFTTVKSVDMTCSIMGQAVTMQLSDMPDCIGKSCDDSLLNTDEGKKELAKLFEAVLLSQGYTATCTPNGGSAPSPTPNFPPTPAIKPFNSASSIFMKKATLVGGGFLLLLANLLLH